MLDEPSLNDDQSRRLGDLIDDFCPRCKRLLNHAIASFDAQGRVAKVICRTCYTEHAFLEGKDNRKKPKQATTAFDQVLAKVSQPAELNAPAPPKKSGKAARYISRHRGKDPKK